MFSLFKTNPIPADGQMDLMEHLAELRARIFRSLLFVIIGMVLTYSLYPMIVDLLLSPVKAFFNGKALIVFNNISDGFMLRMQVCFITGLIVALPFVTMEIWGFIAPALTDNERKPVQFLAPFSVLLFLGGAGIGYVCLPFTYQWMLGFVDDVRNAQLMQNAKDYVLLTAKILLAFGVSFQLPLILLFLARVGLITADIMTKYWRHAVVGIATFAAILTPSADPMSMLMMSIPMSGLYIVSIFLVRAFQPRADGSASLSFSTLMAVALAPVAILVAVAYWLIHPPMATADEGPKPTPSPTPIASPTPNADMEAVKGMLQSLQEQNEILIKSNSELIRRVEALEAKDKPTETTPNEDEPAEVKKP